MQVIKSERPAAASAQGGLAAQKLSMYQTPPTEEITIENLESCALDRLRLLQSIEATQLKGGDKEANKHKIKALMNQTFPLKTDEDALHDQIAHFALRLAYARPNDRAWFVKLETSLFKERLQDVDLSRFLSENHLHYPRLDEREYAAVQDDLRELEQGEERGEQAGPGAGAFFKVRFEEALDLVRDRSALLRGGHIYAHKRQLISVVAARFRAQLSEELAHTYQALPQLQQDDRIAPLLASLARRQADVDYKALQLRPGERIRPEDLDALAKRSYPLCMRQLHTALRAHHHLKHGGRLQYGLFLKGIGLGLEDALEFWRAEFTRKMPLKTFEAQHAYNIRHNYGKEGKGTDYTPLSCTKIIAQKPGPDDHHGCPFAQEPAQLAALLASQGVARADATAIVDLAKGSHFQIACRKHFEVTHPGAPQDLIINHPNNYFRLAQAYWLDPARAATAPAPAPAPAPAGPAGPPPAPAPAQSADGAASGEASPVKASLVKPVQL